MSTKPNDGGPAFPTLKAVSFENPNTSEIARYDLKHDKPGMSLRSYFAGQVLCGIGIGSFDTCQSGAKYCVAYADALISELAKETP